MQGVVGFFKYDSCSKFSSLSSVKEFRKLVKIWRRWVWCLSFCGHGV